MAAIVLVHGGWHGGWCWHLVSDRLRDGGHTVYAPTLTGLGERAHLLTPDVGLETHVADITGLIEREDLNDLVLVGHSYGGFVISCAADRLTDRIRSLVYIDAFVPETDTCTSDYAGKVRLDELNAMADRHGDGWRVPPPDASFWVSDPKLIEWVNTRTTDHPKRCFFDRISLQGKLNDIASRTYVQAEQHTNPQFLEFYTRFSKEPGWRTFQLPTQHDVMLTMPDETADIIASAVDLPALIAE